MSLFHSALASLAALATTVSVTPAEQAAVDRAATRGRLLYAYDQAAWHGTDAFMDRDPADRPRVGGYIVDGPPDHMRLIFFDKNADDPGAVYIVTFAGSHLASSKAIDPAAANALTDTEKRMIAARRIAGQAIADAGLTPCAAKPFNTVVLPPADRDAAIPVYFLTPPTASDRIPLGGHYEVDVAADGTPGPVRHFTKSCLDTPVPKAAKKIEALTVSHVLDPVPTEIHVFSSLALHLPVLVLTVQPTRRLWPVVGDEIRDPRAIDR